jgi:hypothetical protein
MRMAIEDVDSERRASCWVQACGVLHNLLLASASLYMDKFKEDEDEDKDVAPIPTYVPGEKLPNPDFHPTRVRVMNLMGIGDPQAQAMKKRKKRVYE